MEVTVHGPNLLDQSKGQFHVHAAGCRDNRREITANGSEYPLTIPAETRLDVVEDIYHDQLNEQPDDDGGPQRERIKRDWLSEFHFAPCCADLPEVALDHPIEGPAEQVPAIGSAAEVIISGNLLGELEDQLHIVRDVIGVTVEGLGGGRKVTVAQAERLGRVLERAAFQITETAAAERSRQQHEAEASR